MESRLCAVEDCQTNTDLEILQKSKDFKNISLHLLPSADSSCQARQKWLDFLKIKDNPNDRSLNKISICSLHFCPSDFHEHYYRVEIDGRSQSIRKRLKGAYPTIKNPAPKPTPESAPIKKPTGSRTSESRRIVDLILNEYEEKERLKKLEKKSTHSDEEMSEVVEILDSSDDASTDNELKSQKSTRFKVRNQKRTATKSTVQLKTPKAALKNTKSTGKRGNPSKTENQPESTKNMLEAESKSKREDLSVECEMVDICELNVLNDECLSDEDDFFAMEYNSDETLDASEVEDFIERVPIPLDSEKPSEKPSNSQSGFAIHLEIENNQLKQMNWDLRVDNRRLKKENQLLSSMLKRYTEKQ